MSDTGTLNKPPLEMQTTAGNCFVSNYPLFSFWQTDGMAKVNAAMKHAPLSLGEPLTEVAS